MFLKKQCTEICSDYLRNIWVFWTRQRKQRSTKPAWERFDVKVCLENFPVLTIPSFISNLSSFCNEITLYWHFYQILSPFHNLLLALTGRRSMISFDLKYSSCYVSKWCQNLFPLESGTGRNKSVKLWSLWAPNSIPKETKFWDVSNVFLERCGRRACILSQHKCMTALTCSLQCSGEAINLFTQQFNLQ